MPRPGRLSYEECRKRNAAGVSAYWDARSELAVRSDDEAARDRRPREIGELSEREILIAGAIAYWCEGSKSKTIPSQ